MAEPTPSAVLSPTQAALLRIVCTVAWADGECSSAERELLAGVVARQLHADGTTPPTRRRWSGSWPSGCPSPASGIWWPGSPAPRTGSWP
ncbi:MAG: hypothetical protein ER33_06100 [Cyanobium sp. CACIAM 14]|nr:MAG: hypothetical protein ER33_06100 [Cyanobium sp. CACIAM 14]